MVGLLSPKPSQVAERETLFCKECDFEHHETESTSKSDIRAFEELWAIFDFILPKLTRTPGPRIAAMVTLKRVLMHSPNSDHMHLSSSTSGEFCLHSLRSSIRELRVATGFVVRPQCTELKLG